MSSSTYNCGRCRQPLTLRTTSASESLLSIKESQYDLLASQIHVPASVEANDPGISKILNNDQSPLLPRKVVGLSKSTLARQTTQEKLFERLSSESEIDHPLCSECAETWAASMGQAIEAMKQERELLTNYEKQALEHKDELADKNEQLKKDTIKLEEEERQLVSQLLKVEQQKTALDEELKRLDDEEREIEREEAE